MFVDVKIASQESEARLGYMSALSMLPHHIPVDDVIAWDSGGASFQFSTNKTAVTDVSAGTGAGVGTDGVSVSIATATGVGVGKTTVAESETEDHSKKTKGTDCASSAPLSLDTFLGALGNCKSLHYYYSVLRDLHSRILCKCY